MSGHLRRNDSIRPATAADRDELWATLRELSILDRRDWAIGFLFDAEDSPYPFPRYGLTLRVEGAQLVSFDVNAPYFIEQPTFEQLRSWIERRVASSTAPIR